MKEHGSFNRCYRLLWSGTTEQWKPVPETARTAKKGGRGKAANTLTLAGVLPGVAMSLFVMSNLAAQPPPAPPTPPAATQLPTGGNVVGGQATISQSAIATAANMVVNQSSQRAIIDWSSFNLGASATVQFVQPNAQSVILNRVLDPNPTQVFGRINANGQVFLTNPYGVYFAPSASVDVGGLVATTYSISNDDFMSGRYTFNRNGSTASVINQGNLSASLGGYIALLAPEVQNSGVVLARAGTVAFAAGEQVSLSIADGKGLSGITTTASAIASLIDNKLAVQAPDGQIILSAVAVNKLQGGVIKNSGSLQATSLSNQGGKIVLEGDEIELASTASIDVSGRTRGGTVLMGGDWQGSGNLRQATKVSMAAGATINANATDSGDGGKVVLWSNVSDANSTTTVAGSIYASAGPNGGNGGQVETSGYAVALDSPTVIASGTNGIAGVWLTDPTYADSTINSTVATTYVNALSNGTSVIDSVTGNLTVSSAINVTSANATIGNLTLIATGDISIQANISLKGTGAGAGSFTANAAGNVFLSGNFSTASNATSITTTGGNVSLYSNSGGTTTATPSDKGAAIKTWSGSVINTSGGAINLGSAGSTGFAQGGNANNSIGIYLVNTILNSSGGNINLSGASTYASSSAWAKGIQIDSSSSLLAGSGNITLTGQYQSTDPSAIGVYFCGTYASPITLNSTGTITLNGSAGYSTTSATTNADISLVGAKINNALNGITLVADRVSLSDSNFSVNTLNLSAITAGVTPKIALSGSATILNISTATTLDNIISGSGCLTQAGTGALTLTANNSGYTGNITINSGSQLNFNSSADVTLSGLISSGSSGNMTQQGTGKLILSGNSTGYAGNLSISSGSSLTLGTGSSSGIIGNTNASASFLNIRNNGTLNFNRSDNITMQGVISGSGAVNQQGTGNLTLSGNNTYAGNTTISSGMIYAGVNTTGGVSFTSAALGLGTIRVLSGGTFVPNGQYIYNPIEIAGTGAANSLGALWNSATSLSSLVYGNITLTANNVLIGANSNSGMYLYGDIFSLANNSYGFTVAGPSAAGTHLVGSKSIQGNITVNASSFYLDPSSSANATFANNFTIASGSTLYINPSASYSVTVNGSVAGAGNATIGARLPTLGSFINGNFTLAGTTNITSNNTLTFNNSADSVWASNITDYGNLSVVSTGNLSLTGNSTTFWGKLNISAGSNVTIGDGVTSGIVAGGIINNGIANFNRTDALTYSGAISGTGQLNKLGSNVLTLSGNSTFAGNTTIRSGVLKVSNVSSLGSNPNVTINDTSGAGLEISVNSYVLGSLSGGANATLNVSTFGVTAGSNNLSTTYAGALVGSGTFTKNGTGSLTLSGNSGSFTGNVTSNGTGALIFTNTTVIGNGTNQVQLVANGSSLELQNVTNFATPINLSENATLVVNTANSSLANNLTIATNKIATLNVTAGLNLSVSGKLNGSGVINKNTDGLVTLSGNNSAFTGTLNVSKGLLIFANNLSLGSSAINTGNVTLGTVSSAPTDTGNGAVWLNASDTTLLNNLTVNASGAITGNANLNISNSSYRLILNASNTSSLSGLISGPGILTLGSVSTPVAWSLSGANTFGSLGLNSVKLTLVSDSVVNATGAIVSSPLGLLNNNMSSIDIGTNSVLDINGHTLANALKVSTGKLVNTQGTGQITGYLNAGNNFEINVSDNSSLILSGELHGSVAGSMSLVKNGNGTLNIQPTPSGTGQYLSGVLQVNAGKLILDAANLTIINLASPVIIGTGASLEIWRSNGVSTAANITNNGLLRFNRSSNLSVTGSSYNISGTGAVQFSGTAVYTWNPSGNSYTGGTTIDPGAQVNLQGTYSLGNVTVPVVNNGTLKVPSAGTPGIMLNQTITGAGNLIFATDTNATWVSVLGNNNYTGTTTLTGSGTVYVGSYLNTSTSGSLGTGNITINDNATLVFARADNTTVYNNISSSTLNSTLAKSQNNVTLDLAGNINLTGAMKIYGGTVQIDTNGSMGNTSTHVYNGAISIFNTSTFEFSSATDAVLNGNITQNATSYTATLIKDTSVSNLTLNGNNNYTNTVIEAGTLYVGSGGAGAATGKLGTGTVVDNASLVFNHSGAYSLSTLVTNTSGITGTGNVTVISTNNDLTIDRNITLTGANSLIKLMAGTSLGANNATGNVTLSNNISTTSTGTLIVYAGSPLTVNTTSLMNKTVGASGAVGYKTYNATLSNISSAVASTRNFFYRIQPTATINGGNVTATKVYDGTTIAYPNYTGGGSTTGIDGDTLTGCVTGASYNTSSAGNKSLTYNVSIVSNNASWVVAGYAGTVNPTSTVANITQAPLTIQANDAADFVTLAAASGPFAGVSYSGFVHGENATTAGLTGTLNISRAAGNSAGTYALTPSGLSANNYAISYRTGNYTIVPAQQLIIRVSDGTNVYGDASNLSVSSVTYLMPDNVTIVNLTPSLTTNNGLYSINDGVGGTASFKLGLSNANLTASSHAAVGLWNVGYNNLTIGGSNFNSIIAVGTQSITKRDLTLTTVADNKVYDGNTNATFNISTNRVSGDNLTLSTDALGVFANRNAANGTVVTVGNITISGNDASNYNLLSNVSTTTANITPKTLTLSGLTANNKVYDATANATIATLGTVSGMLGLDDVQVGTSAVTGAFSDKNVGNGKTVTLTGFTMGGAEAGNYKIDSATTTANITPKALTVSGLSVAASKVYDGTTTAAPLGTANLQDAIAAGTGTSSDGKAYSGDSIGITGTPVGTYNSKDVATAANVSITGLTLTNNTLGNYVLTAPAPLAATITPKDLTVKVNDDAQFFTVTSNTVGFNGVSYKGFVTGESSANLTFSNRSAPGVPNISTSLNATQKSTTGVYAGALTLDGTVTNSNYNITVQTGNFTVVGADQLLVRVNNVNTTYGTAANLVVGSAQYVSNNTNVLLNLNVSSSGNQVTVDDGLGSGGGAVMTLSPTVLASQLSGSHNAKVGIYNIGGTVTCVTSGVNFNNTVVVVGTETVTAKALTATATAADKTYNSNASATVTVTSSDVITGDTVGYAYTSAEFLNKNADTNKAVTVANISLSGTDAGNYVIQNLVASTTANITQKALTITGITAENKVYNGTTAAVVNVSAVNSTSLVGMGLVTGDNLTLSATGAFADKNAGDGKTVNLTSTYAGADVGNYLITSQVNTTANITQKTLTITGITASDKVYNGTNVAAVNVSALNSTSLVGMGMLANDTVTVSATGVFADKNVGTNKTVNLTRTYGGSDAGNYNIVSQVNTTANITAKDVTLAAPQATQVYNGSAIYTANATQLAALSTELGVVGDSVTGVTLTYNNPNAATGKTLTATSAVISDGNSGHNYNVSYTTNTTSVITAKDVTLVAPQVTRTYDGTANYTANVTQLAALTSALGVAGDSVSNITLVYNDQNAATGKTLTASSAVISDGNSGHNYNVSYATNTTSVITAKDVTLVAPQVTRTYDGTVNYTANATQLAALTSALGVAGDSVTSVLLAYNDKNVGTGRTLTASNAVVSDGNNGLNYNISYTNNTASVITAKDVTLAAPQASRAYDGTVNYTANATQLAALTAALGVAGDSVSNITLAYNSPNAATGKTLTASNAVVSDGNNGLNYNISYAGNNASVITPKTLTISGITAENKTYDGNTAAVVNVSAVNSTSLVGMGLVSGDNVSVTATGVFADKEVGTHKTVTLSSVYGGSDAGNYNINSQASTWADITAATSSSSSSSSSSSNQNQTTRVDILVVPKLIASSGVTTPIAAVSPPAPMAMPSLNLPDVATTVAMAAPISQAPTQATGSNAPPPPLASTASTSGVLPVSVLGDSRVSNLGMTYSEQPNDIRIQMTTSPDVPKLTATAIRFTGNFKTFIVNNDRGEMVPYQGAMIGKRIVILAETEASKNLARQEMQTVLAAAITTLGSTGSISLAQVEGVVLDLR